MTIYKGAAAGDVALRDGDDASELVSVGGDLHIHAGGAALAMLTVVDGNLRIRARDVLLPALISVVGDVYIEADGARAPTLTEVGGYLFLWGDDAQLVALTNVAGDVYVEAEGAQLPALNSVGGSLYVRVHGARVAHLRDDERETLIRFNGMRPLAKCANSAEALIRGQAGDVGTLASKPAALPIADLAAIDAILERWQGCRDQARPSIKLGLLRRLRAAIA